MSSEDNQHSYLGGDLEGGHEWREQGGVAGDIFCLASVGTAKLVSGEK